MEAEQTGGLVLCGGRSQRMGRPKHLLPFGGQTLLERVLSVVTGCVGDVAVVAANGQSLPQLDAAVRVVCDAEPDLGPLSGLAAGLTAMADACDAVFVSSCDAPFLKPEFIREMLSRLGPHDIAIVRDEEHFHPLAAVYRTRIAPTVQGLVTARRLRPIFLLEECDAAIVTARDLDTIDPGLESLRNMNTPEDYHTALAEAGLPPEACHD